MRYAFRATSVSAPLQVTTGGAVFLLQRQLQYAPTHCAPSSAEDGFDGANKVMLTTADAVRVVLWSAAAPAGCPTILYLHGNADEIAERPKRWSFWRQAGFGVAFVSYRGLGGSGGTITGAGLHRDADAAHDGLMARGVAPGRLAMAGESPGTVVAVRLAGDRPAGALLPEAAPYLDSRYCRRAPSLAARAPADAGPVPLDRPDWPGENPDSGPAWRRR